MRDFVIDANVLMSILISGKATYRPLLASHNFVLPDYALIEIEKYNDVLRKKTRMKEEEFSSWTYFVFSKINVLPHYILSKQCLDKTFKLLEKIDLKDISYVALAMQLDLVSLTRDVPLYSGLRRQGYKKVMLFEDFLRMV